MTPRETLWRRGHGVSPGGGGCRHASAPCMLGLQRPPQHPEGQCEWAGDPWLPFRPQAATVTRGAVQIKILHSICCRSEEKNENSWRGQTPMALNEGRRCHHYHHI